MTKLEIENILISSGYKLIEKETEYGDLFVEEKDEFEFTLADTYIINFEPYKVILEYSKSSGEAISVTFVETIVTSLIIKNIDEYDGNLEEEFDKFIFIGKTKLNKYIINRCIEIHKNPLKSKADLLDSEATIIKYINKLFSGLFINAGLSLMCYTKEYPFTSTEVDDVMISYGIRNETFNEFGFPALFIYINLIEETLLVHLYNRCELDHIGVDLYLDVLGENNDTLVDKLEDAMINVNLL